MDEDRRIVPKRLLSFDAGQMSLSRLGKAFYNNPNSRQTASTTPKPEAFDTAENCTVSYETKGPIACMAVNTELCMTALVSKEGLDLIQLEGARARKVSSLKTNNSLRLMPTAAAWQGKRHSLGAFEGSASSLFASSSFSQQQGSQTSASKLAVSDSNGTFRVYAYKGSSSGSQLSLDASSISVGRAIRSLSFNTEQQNVLVTAVSDGSSRCWDLRQGLKRPVLTFSRSGDVTREVQFQPGSEYKFASIYDSGVVQRWDLRHRQSPDCRINAHQQGLALDWHPSLNYLATGGRDHLIQVWDMNPSSGTSATDLLGGGISPEYVVRVPNSVSEVSWLSEPGLPIWKSSLATSGRPIESNNLKGTFSVWSLSRPHVPTYTVESHKDSITSIYATGMHTVWSAGLDGKFFQTDLRYEPKVADNFPPALVSMAPWDMAGVAFPCTQSATTTSATPPVPANHQIAHPAQHPAQHPPSFSRRPSQLTLLQSQKLSNASQGVGGMPQGLPIADAGSITNRRPINQRTNSHGLQRNFSTLALPTHIHSAHSPRPGHLSSSPGSTVSPPFGSLPGSQSESVPSSVPKSAPGFIIGSNPVSTPGSVANSIPSTGPNSLSGSNGNSRPGSEPGSAPGSLPRSFSAVSPINPQGGVSPINLFAANKSGGGGPAQAAAKLASLNLGSPASPSVFYNEADPAADPCVDLKYIIEVGLPFENCQSLSNTAHSLMYSKGLGQSYGEVCRHNAHVMLQQSRFRYSELWSQLGVAIDHLEAKFLRALKAGSDTDAEQYKMAESWFSGVVDDHYEVSAVAVDDRTKREDVRASISDVALFEDTVGAEQDGESLEDPDWVGSPEYNNSSVGSSPLGTPQRSDSNKWSKYRRRYKSGSSKGSLQHRMRGSFVSTHRPSILHKSKDPFQLLKEKYWTFVESQNKPWEFFPMLKQSIGESLQMGYFVSCATLVLLFRAFPGLSKDFNTSEILLGGLRALQQISAFCPAAHIRKTLRQDVDRNADWFDSELVLGKTNNPDSGDPDAPDTVCHRCLRSLSENAAFYARNDVSVGYWYCSKCKLPLENCCLCDGPINGLCKVNIGCGHRTHVGCWDTWTEVEKMQVCPSGCGQLLTGL